MKNIFRLPLLSAFVLLSFVFSGCLKDSITKTYTIYTPVYRDKAEVLAGIKTTEPQAVKEAGKIYIYGTFLFLNEVNKGVHIFNNSNPSNPVRVGFIDIPGNIDIAVKGTTLYADLYTDLLAIDIANPLQAKVSKIIPRVFPERWYGDNFIADSTKVIVNWNKKDTTVDVATGSSLFNCRNCVFAMQSDAGSLKSGGGFTPGMGGSMARFAIVNEHLYAVNISSLNVLDVSNSNFPDKLNVIPVGWNIETIYPFKNKLFIGSSAGMFIFDITNPSSPQRQGQFNHARACDPVVADDNYAFVTLRAGNFCTGVNNQLDVIDVRNVLAPSLVKTYSMTNPHGLAKDGDILFVCDGKDGLKIYNTSNVNDLKLINHLKNMETFDAIAWNNILILVTNEGVFQYDYTDVKNLKLLSKISGKK
ncbi:MAG: hypothetical protein H0V91_09380 [Flavisolibacter sp.]|jgi:hypothetical protein|nr:hypothetical protein [Flavisolibacter sp.]